MCVICYKERGKKLPDEATMRAMWRSNPDGAGVMWKTEKGVDFRKGFMKFDDFLGFVRGNESMLNETECAMHFRIGTHGGNTPGNTHPFIVRGDADLHKLSGEGEAFALMHNGVLPITPRAQDISDTGELALRAGAFKEPEKFLRSVNELIGMGNKIVLFRTNGDALFFGGRWEQGDDGLLYSNLNHGHLFSFGGSQMDIFYGFENKEWHTRKKKKNKPNKKQEGIDFEDIPLPFYLDLGMGLAADEIARDCIYEIAQEYVGMTYMTEEEWTAFFDEYKPELEDAFWSDKFIRDVAGLGVEEQM